MKRTTILTFFASTLFLVVPLGSSIGSSPPQRAENKKCPTIEVNGPKKSKAFRNILYRAKVKNFSDATPPIFKWSLVGGVLLNGQGSDVITVEPQDYEVTATLLIENTPVGCRSNSDTVVTKITDIPYIHPPPVVDSLTASPYEIVRRCPTGTRSDACAATGEEVQLTASVSDPPFGRYVFTWFVTGGRVKGEGKTATWDLSGVASGTYTATIEAGYLSHTFSGSIVLTVRNCADCKPVPTLDATKLSECLFADARDITIHFHETKLKDSPCR